MSEELFVTTASMRATAIESLAAVHRHSISSPAIDEAILIGIADGMDVTLRDAADIHAFFEMIGAVGIGAAPKMNISDSKTIVAGLYGGTFGLRWCARIIEKQKKK